MFVDVMTIMSLKRKAVIVSSKNFHIIKTNHCLIPELKVLITSRQRLHQTKDI